MNTLPYTARLSQTRRKMDPFAPDALPGPAVIEARSAISRFDQTNSLILMAFIFNGLVRKAALAGYRRGEQESKKILEIVAVLSHY